MTLRRAKTAEEYIDWIKNAVFEAKDLKDCFMFEIEDMTRFPSWVEPLEKMIGDVHQSMVDGTYHFGREDLPFMDILYRYGDQIPFHTLLKQINETHRKGLEVQEDDD